MMLWRLQVATHVIGALVAANDAARLASMQAFHPAPNMRNAAMLNKAVTPVVAASIGRVLSTVSAAASVSGVSPPLIYASVHLDFAPAYSRPAYNETSELKKGGLGSMDRTGHQGVRITEGCLNGRNIPGVNKSH